jgi:hypothetical protein
VSVLHFPLISKILLSFIVPSLKNIITSGINLPILIFISEVRMITLGRDWYLYLSFIIHNMLHSTGFCFHHVLNTRFRSLDLMLDFSDDIAVCLDRLFPGPVR